jgi:hypothetical protein
MCVAEQTTLLLAKFNVWYYRTSAWGTRNNIKRIMDIFACTRDLNEVVRVRAPNFASSL